jgi:hypothetical protein
MAAFPALSNADAKSFEKALLEFSKIADPSSINWIATVDAITQASGLGPQEKARRVDLLFRSQRFITAEPDQFFERAQQWPPIIKNAVSAALSPDQRQRMYSQQRTAAVSDPSLPNQSTISRQTSVVSKKTEDEFRAVLLLGAADAHEGNHSFLTSKNFSPIRVADPAALAPLLTSPICGIVVDGSWWTKTPDSEHESQIRQLLSFSSFVFLKIDTNSLSLPLVAKLPLLCRTVRFRDPSFTELGLSVSSRLGDIDTAPLNEAASYLGALHQIRFHPAEITENEALVLLAAIRKNQAGRSIFAPVQVECVRTSIVHGGRSFAKVVILRPDDGSAPLIAKIDDLERLKSEMERFKSFVETWQPQLRPELHVHEKVALIFFCLIDSTGDQQTPAPTFCDRLDALAFNEHRTGVPSEPDFHSLKQAISTAVDRLVILNQRSCASGNISNSCWIGTEPLDALKTRGVEFSLTVNGSPIDLPAMIAQARERVAKLDGKAIVHGDVHSRNILVRHDREPLFIDFASSGPGHPAFDLARFESALLFTYFRMVSDEARVSEFLHVLFTSAVALDDLKRTYPDLLASQSSQLAIHTSIQCRLGALRVLRQFGGDEMDYYAMKILIACQALTLPACQQGIVRASLSALHLAIAQ